ncbi:Fimbria adhesin protein precursor [compost metagenome]
MTLALAQRRWLRLAVLLLMLLSGPVIAGSCRLAPSNPTILRPSVPLTGNITVGRDLPVGTEIYRREFITTSDFIIQCDPGDYVYHRNFSITPYPVSSYVHPTHGAKVYTTPIAGVGAVILAGGAGALPGVDNMRFTAPTNATLYAGRQYALLLIKIADNVGSGAITGAQFPSPRFRMQGDNTLDFLLGGFTGQVNIVSRTCTTPDVSVNLGTHQMSALSGVGTGTSWVNVPIRLTNCPAFHARSLTGSYNDRGQANQTATANTIGYRVNPVTSVVNPAQGVMALQPDGVNQTATGIGIQMVDASNNPLTYGVRRASGLALTATNNASYTINLRARYYQTATTPTSGQANGAATVTLIYE